LLKSVARIACVHEFGHGRADAAKPRQPQTPKTRRPSEQDAKEHDMASPRAVAGDTAADQAPLKLEEFLPYQLNVVSSLVSQALSRVYVRRYRIGVPEWRVLVTLGQYGVMTAKAIGAHTHMHKTKVSRAVALMEKRKLLVRRANRADMREAFLSLTAAGSSMYEEVAPHALDFARRLTEILSPADREVFNRALMQLTERSAKLVDEVAAHNDIAEDDL
jgi:DNA-binding MarR family transcriptional regulator